MTRNWGLPPRPDQTMIRQARSSRPLATLGLSAIYGIFGAAVAAISFDRARGLTEDLFHGSSLIWAVAAAGFGCWLYVLLARARFAAHFTGEGDAFSDLVRFFARGAVALGAALVLATLARFVAGGVFNVVLLCAAGGAGAAAAFQTVLAFVPGPGAPENP